MNGKVALTLGSVGLSVALMGGMALAAFEPAATQAPLERKGPPVARLEELLQKLVDEGKLTAELKATIVARLQDALGKPAAKPELRNVLEHAMAAAATYLGMTEKDLLAELRTGRSIAEVAVAKGKTRDGVIDAIVADANKKIDDAVAGGKITVEQAAKAKDGLRERAAKLVDAKRTPPVKRVAPVKPIVPNERAFLGGATKAARDFLGLTEQAIQTELKAGKSLAEIAVGNGKTRDGLIAAIAAPALVRIDEQKTAGKLTAEQVTQAKQKATDAAAKLVDAKRAVKKTT